MAEPDRLWLFDSRSGVISSAEGIARDLNVVLQVWARSSDAILDLEKSGILPIWGR